MKAWSFARQFASSRWCPHGSRQALLARQDRAAQAHLAWVRDHSPFYRDHWAGHPLSDWHNLPSLDKSVMMGHFDTLNTAGLSLQRTLAVAERAERERDFQPSLGRYTAGLSSGTSGARGVFVVSPEEQAAWAGAMLAKMLPPPLGRPQRVAFFLRANSNLYTSVRSALIAFEWYDLLDPLPRHLQRLNTQQPTILVGPPSMLRWLGGQRQAGSLAIHPAHIISVAEVLDPFDEQLLKAHFEHDIIHQVYQATEGFLGCSCRLGTLHLNEELVAIQPEWIDRAHRRFVPIITDLQRRTQPIVRYRLNDVLTAAKTPCACGNPSLALEQIEGRRDDVFELHDADGHAVLVFPDFLRRAVGGVPGVSDFVVRQRSLDQLEVDLAVVAERTAVELAVSAALNSLWRRLEVQAPRLLFGHAASGPSATKLRRVQRLVDGPPRGMQTFNTSSNRSPSESP